MTKPKWAIAQVGGFSIPLVGLPPSATEEMCDYCGYFSPLQLITLTGTHFLCRKHLRMYDEPQPPTVNC